MRFIDFFAGVGGFRRGMELAGHECVGFCEFDQYATASYVAMHCATDEQLAYIQKLPKKDRLKEILKDEYRNGEWYANDVRNVRVGCMPVAECWTFGAPCQDFSIAGLRRGLDGERSSLVGEIFRLLREIGDGHRPEWLIYENVKGMLSSNNGFDFACILAELDECGYDAEWCIFNSKDYGVPQNRERVYVVGHLRTKGERKVLFDTRADGQNCIQIKQIGGLVTHRDNPNRYRVYDATGIAPTLDDMGGGGREPHIVLNPNETDNSMYTIRGGGHERRSLIWQKNQPKQKTHDALNHDTTLASTNEVERIRVSHTSAKKGVIIMGDYSRPAQKYKYAIPDNMDCPALQARDYKGATQIQIPVYEATTTGFTNAVVGEDSVNFAHAGSDTKRGRVGHNIANTLDTNQKQGVFVKVGEDLECYAVYNEQYDAYVAIRKLTPRECFRLQGWTDEYFERAQLINSDAQLYKQAGNGVTVNVVHAIAVALN